MNKQDMITQTRVKEKKDRRERRYSFQLSWLDIFKWLAYSPSLEGVLCVYCVLFGNKVDGRVTDNLVTKQLQNLCKARGHDRILDAHNALKIILMKYDDRTKVICLSPYEHTP